MFRKFLFTVAAVFALMSSARADAILWQTYPIYSGITGKTTIISGRQIMPVNTWYNSPNGYFAVWIANGDLQLWQYNSCCGWWMPWHSSTNFAVNAQILIGGDLYMGDGNKPNVQYWHTGTSSYNVPVYLAIGNDGNLALWETGQ